MDDEPATRLPEKDQPDVRPGLRARESSTGGYWRPSGSTAGSSSGGASDNTGTRDGGATDSTAASDGGARDATAGSSGGATDSTGGVAGKLSGAENAAPFSFSPSALASTGTIAGGARFVGNMFFGNNKRRAGTGAAGLLIGGAIVFFSVGSGPFEFVQIAHLLEDFHFSSQQDAQDDRFTKMVRFIRYASKGQVERTRMGYLGNKFTDRFETKLNASGLTSAYTDKFGLLDGYVVDTDDGPYKGMDEDQVKNALKEQGINADIVKGSEIPGHSAAIADSIVIKASDLSYKDSLALNYRLLQAAGYNKLSAAIGARQFCVRAGCDWHPLSSKISNAKRALEDWLKGEQEDNATGEEPLGAEDTSAEPSSQDSADKSTKAAVDSSIQSTTEEAAGVGGSQSKFAAFKESTSAKILGGGTVALGVLCMVKSVNDDAGQIKQTQVVLPLIRMAMSMIATGNQVESGQDINPAELGELSTQLDGVDSNGQTTSWYQSESIQANLGNSNTGVAPDSTLTSIGQGAPFGFLDSGVLGSILSPVCSAGGQIAQGIFGVALDFTGIGGVIANLGTGLLQSIFTGPVMNQVAHWLAGSAVDVASVGADFGNDIDYGGALAGNAQAINSGGTALSQTQVSQLQNDQSTNLNNEFREQSLAYRILSPDSTQSLASQVVDAAGTNVASMFSNLGYGFMHIGGYLADLPDMFMSKARAATQSTYNYGFPTYGFSEQDMDDPAVENPYQNADVVQGLLSAPGETYISNASKCFGVTIAQDQAGRWDVTSPAGSPDVSPYNGKYGSLDCDPATPANCTSNTSDACNWLRVRFFILDTETMNSMACYEGNDEACDDVGLGDETQSTTPASISTTPAAASTTPQSGSLPSGSAEQLATELLPYISSGKISCNGQATDCPDIQNTAKGVSIIQVSG